MSEHTPALSKKQRNVLILTLGFIAALGPFSIDMYLPGFPAIADDLGTEISQVSLTLTSYFIGISVGQLVYGPLLDRYGRKKPLLIGLGIYVIASVGCVLVPDVQSLIGLRLLQALGGCVGMVASRAIVRDRFPVNEVARVFSALILVMGAAPIIAPTVGGFLTEHFGWRFIFIVLSLISLLMLVLVVFVLSESKDPDHNVSLRPRQVSRGYWKVLINRDFLMYGLFEIASPTATILAVLVNATAVPINAADAPVNAAVGRVEPDSPDWQRCPLV
ncbi:MAG: Bcr/CflA family efflux MFS transporter, partial [Owenweeksia sp.]